MHANRKLLMLGIDAADIDFIREFLHALPTLRRLLEEGRFFPLKSTAEWTSASVWPSFYTGKTPGNHGISHHIQWDAGAMQMRRLSDDWFSSEPFWSGLERDGFKVCVTDVPFAYPQKISNGVEIINWGSHDLMGRFESVPGYLGREIRQRFGRHPMGYEIPVNKSAGEIKILYDQVIKGARVKGKLLEWLLQNVDWDFFLGVYGECHRGGHILWPDSEDTEHTIPEGALLDVYREVDSSIGSVLEHTDPANTQVIIFSLHGMRANFSQEHFAAKVMDRINERFGAVDELTVEDQAVMHKPQAGLIRKLRESLPAKLQYAVARSVPVQLRDWVVAREVTGGIDWSRTRGFPLRSDVHSFVRFNVAGREREGILEPGSPEYSDYKNWVVRCFMGLRESESGEPITRAVLDADEVLPGIRRDFMPDLVVRWRQRPRARTICSDALGLISAEPDTGRTGEHRTSGFAILHGPGAQEASLPPLSHNTHFPKFIRYLLSNVESH